VACSQIYVSLTLVVGERVAMANDPKLSDTRSRRRLCGKVVGAKVVGA
jgi:hypothetical protein